MAEKSKTGDTREARLSQALRENLKRRKQAQRRARDIPPGKPAKR